MFRMKDITYKEYRFCVDISRVGLYDVEDRVTGKTVIRDVKNIKQALSLVTQWNLQEYEGIDDTEGHL